MPSKKAASRAAPKVSSSNALSSAAETTKQQNRSSVLRHSFAPSHFQLNLFASVVQGYDAQVLRLHDSLTGGRRCEHSLGDGRVSCLDWGYYGAGSGDSRPSKKRKTKDGSSEARYEPGDAVLAVGVFNSPNIEIFSPARAQVIAVLEKGHSQGVKDFRFVKYGTTHKAWSLGGDGKLVEWNLIDGTKTRSISLPSQVAPSNVVFPTESTVLCAQSSIFGIHPDTPSDFETLTGFTSNVHSICSQTPRKDASRIDAVIAAAESERNITLFDYSSQQILGQMMATNAVDRISLSEPQNYQSDALIAITDKGEVEVFERPFDFKDADPKLAKSRKEAARAKTRHPRAVIKVSRPGNATEQVSIAAAEFDGNTLVLGWIEGASHPCFERITWRNGDGSIALNGDVRIEKAKNPDVTTNAKMNGFDVGKTHVDESQTVVTKGSNVGEADSMEVDGPEVIDISSAEEEDSSDEDDAAENRKQVPFTNGTVAEDESEDEDRSNDEVAEDGERREQPSFGEMLRASAPEQVDVAAAFPAKAQTALVPASAKSMNLPSGMSLGMVLAQALRTNDRELLETCFHAQDLATVRATIERLDSTLAGALLEKLAERLHNRPGRAGSLMVWIQWTLVAHGGHLAGQAKVVKQLRQLHGVVRERAQALQPLLLLKGKLDMLEAQMQLRRSMMERSKMLQAAQEDDEEEAIYVEGQEEIDSDEEENSPVDQIGGLAETGGEDIEFDSEEDVNDIPGAMDVDDSDQDEDEDESENELIDREAEETEDEGSEADEDDIDHDDVDSLDEDESSSEEMAGSDTGKPKINGVVKRR